MVWQLPVHTLQRVEMLVVSVSNRVVSLCLRRTYDQAERQMVLSTMYGGEKEEGLACIVQNICSTFSSVCLYWK